MSSVSFNLNSLERPLCLADRCFLKNTLNTQTARLAIVNIAHQKFIRPACIVNKTPLNSGACWNPRSQDNPTPPPMQLRRTRTCPVHPDVFAYITRREGMVESSHTCFAELQLACRAKLVVRGRTRTEKGSSLSAAFHHQRHPHASIKNSDAFLTVQS